MIILFLIHSQKNENRINPIYLRNKHLTTQSQLCHGVVDVMKPPVWDVTYERPYVSVQWKWSLGDYSNYTDLFAMSNSIGRKKGHYPYLSYIHLKKKYCNTLIFFSWQNCATQVFYYWQKCTQNSTGMLQIEHYVQKLKLNVIQFIS